MRLPCSGAKRRADSRSRGSRRGRTGTVCRPPSGRQHSSDHADALPNADAFPDADADAFPDADTDAFPDAHADTFPNVDALPDAHACAVHVCLDKRYADDGRCAGHAAGIPCSV